MRSRAGAFVALSLPTIPTGARHATQRITDQHDRRGAGFCAGAGLYCHAFAAAGAGGLPAGRGHHRPLYPRVCGGCRHRGPVGRNWCHVADVRCGAAFFAGRSAGRAQTGAARCRGADFGGHGAGHGPCQLVGLEYWRGFGVWPLVVGGQHRGVAAGAGNTQPARHLQRPRRRGLAGGGRPGDGAGAGVVATRGPLAGGWHGWSGR